MSGSANAPGRSAHQSERVTPGPTSRFSSAIHLVDRASSRPVTAVIAGGAIVVFGIVLAVAGFPQTWETAFASVCAAVTTVMVFIIQHTQSREQSATQLKLDELIRALPAADDRLVHLEVGADEEIAELEQRQVEHHLSVRAEE